VRSAAITQFVQSPAASHRDVIELIRKLQDSIATRSRLEKEAKDAKADAAGTAAPQAAAVSASAGGDESVSDGAVDLLLESVILRVFDTDATWFVLAFLLDPQTIASAPQRTTASILTNLRQWAPVDRTVAVLRVLLEPRRRWALGFFLQKQILRLLFECSDANSLARELFHAEWNQRNAKETEMPTDVRHDVVKLAVAALGERNEGKQALAWSICDDLVAEVETRAVDPASLLLLLTPIWQPNFADVANCSSLRERAAALSGLLRGTAPPAVYTAGGAVAPHSFGYFHSQLVAEGSLALSFPSSNERAMCARMAALLEKLSRSTQHPFLRSLSQMQQFLYSALLEGVTDDQTSERMQQLLMHASVEVQVETAKAAASPSSSSSSSSSSAAALRSPLSLLSVSLEDTREWSLAVLPRLYAGLTLQVLTRALVTAAAPAADSSRADGDEHPCVRLCIEHPYAVRLRATVSALLQALLHTPPVQALRRLCVSKALYSLLTAVSQTPLPSLSSLHSTAQSTSWAVELIQRPFKEELNFLRQDATLCNNLLPGKDK
jgi:hypothetical protein